jgi:Mrr restriction endonuclease-like protein
MPIPDFQTLMLPLLRFAGDGNEHSIAEARSAIAADLKLTPEELAQMLPSGRAPLFANRLAWAKQYLSAAGLLGTPKRAYFVITSDGAELLRKPPARIDIKFLGRYPAFATFRAKTVKTSIGVVTIPEEEDVGAADSDIAAAPTVHTEIQAVLLRLGAEMSYDVWVARNDRSRTVGNKQFVEFPRMLTTLPVQFDEATKRTIELIDVLWLKGKAIIAAFEVESTTSIYSGLLRMADLVSMQPNINIPLYLVAPDERRDKVFAEVNRPTFAALQPPLAEICRYIGFETLREEIKKVEHVLRYLRPEFLEELSESCELGGE